MAQNILFFKLNLFKFTKSKDKQEHSVKCVGT